MGPLPWMMASPRCTARRPTEGPCRIWSNGWRRVGGPPGPAALDAVRERLADSEVDVHARSGGFSVACRDTLLCDGGG